MSKLDKLSQLAQATPTAMPVVKRDEVKSVPIENSQPPKTKPAMEKTSPKPEASVSHEPEELAMPPSRDAEPRVQVIFRPTADLNDRLKKFCDKNHATIQDTVSLALEEFLTRRGS